MSGNIFEPAAFRVIGGIWLTAFAVRLMDDYLDREYDLDRGRVTLGIVWGRAVLPYALLALSWAGFLAPGPALAFFAAAYVTGMVGEMRASLPLGLPAWVEGVLFLGGAASVVGAQQAATAVLAVTAIQAWDDLADWRREAERGSRNWVCRWGKNPVIIFACAGTGLALWLNPVQTAGAFCAVPAVNLAACQLAAGGGGEEPQ